ncbi:MAG: lipopolysaccharide biosynthesis protein [Cyanobacteria bacterium J083]|nr:MAG: lipopolysaccharide biosynthesis protein [Cyanobacteria bacterium J083]
MKNPLDKADPNQYLRIDHLKVNLKQRSIRGGVITVVSQTIKFLLQIGSTAVIARLLSPEDYGLFGMVAVIAKFMSHFKDLGLATATAQRSEINQEQTSALFWINVTFGCITAICITLLAPAIARFYNEPRLTEITLAIASSFIVSGLTVQYQALLKRQMEFTSLAKIEIFSMVVGVVTGISTAWLGLGYWVLVLMLITTAISNAVGVWLACGWRPKRPLWTAEVVSMLAFGRNLTGFNLTNYFSRNLDNILIGRYWGAEELGFYGKAYQLLLLPVRQISFPLARVALPTLSRLQTEPEKHSRYYYKANLLMTIFGFPLVAFAFTCADKIILLVLGQKWLEVVPIYRLLAPAAFMSLLDVPLKWAYTSLNRTDRLLRWGIISSVINIVIFLSGLRWGAIGIAATYGLSRPIYQLVAFCYCFQGTHLNLAELIKTLSQPAIASLGAAAMMIGINHLLPDTINIFIYLSLDLLLYILIYLTIWMILPNGKKTLLGILKIF